jgi:hypothetical protein
MRQLALLSSSAKADDPVPRPLKLNLDTWNTGCPPSRLCEKSGIFRLMDTVLFAATQKFSFKLSRAQALASALALRGC